MQFEKSFDLARQVFYYVESKVVGADCVHHLWHLKLFEVEQVNELPVTSLENFASLAQKNLAICFFLLPDFYDDN